MKIVLIIRRNKNYWLNNKIDHSCIANDYRSNFILQMIQVWNFCFKMKYIDFRIRLRDIAFPTFERNNFDDIIMYFDEDKYNSLEKGTLIVPIDEDDWFSLYLVENLRKIQEPFNSVYWDTHFREADGELNTNSNQKKCSISCAYGMKVPCSFNVIKYHAYAKKNGYYLSKFLSFKNQNISSLSFFHFMARTLTIKQIIEMLKKNINNTNNTNIYLEEYKQEHILYKELLKELLESLRIKI